MQTENLAKKLHSTVAPGGGNSTATLDVSTPLEETMGKKVPGKSAVVGSSKPRLLDVLGPGLITGASDDDPSGIATYSQAGAMFGMGLLWTMVLTYPLMVAVQEI